MQSRIFLFLDTALILFLFPCSRTISAQERTEPVAVQAQSDTAQSPSPELAVLPVQLTNEQFANLQELPPSVSSDGQVTGSRRVGFYRGAFNRPFTPREVALRESVYRLAVHRNQFVHVRLVDGKVLTGTITFTSAEAFQIQTDILRNSQMIHYRQLSEPPRQVFAIGTRTVRGLETTGLVVACIVAIPVALALYPLVVLGVIRD